MSKIGIMGGTFDPIHTGHIQLADRALLEVGLDFVLFVPNYIPWMKQGRSVTKAEQRAAMVKLAIEDFPAFRLSTVELDAGGNSYTWQTLEKLKAQYPGDEFYFILGADSLMAIEKWAYPERIFANAVILAAVRDGCDREALQKQKDMLIKKYHAQIQLLSMPPVAISSTEIRQKFYTDPQIRKLIPQKTANYIIREHLY